MHRAVLLKEAVEALVTTPGGFYVDGTFGRGGHSEFILSCLDDKGRLLAVDKDPMAQEVAQSLALSDSRFEFFHGSFAQLPHQLRRMGIGAVDGILLDLGVSSPQLDDKSRGFSFMHDGPLDMRMDTTCGETAAQWLSYASEQDIARVLKEYGEERFGRRIAAAIVAAREEEPITSTGRLAKVVSEANPKWERKKHPATRSFQAIRIQINRELGDLEDLLAGALTMLRIGGRLVVISFHSLEDRMVKRYMRNMARGDEIPAGVPIVDSALNRRMKIVGKAAKAGEDEVAINVRARSAVMRVAMKIC
ncbi:MAG: 16S rRNA (cytosine(1402)-N(4))-methyltransferase RsmH [Halieaceae bacterium]|mgnify:CR=1 FL=1|jgi:16S rRNA (cytosine1402-N4)-methyltransferase|nr:16S rRNA (cytosine(1402)-N(4))-methyltransferase RsmH [Halieaceae bacterium]